MDPNKKPRVEQEKSNTIIKIKLSDMLGPQKPEDEQIYSDSEEDFDDDDEEENLEENLEDEEQVSISQAEPVEEGLSSSKSQSGQDNISNFPPEEDSPSHSQINQKQPFLNDLKTLSEEGGMSNNEELLDKSPMKIENEIPDIEKNDGILDIGKDKVVKEPFVDPSQNSQGQFWKYRKPTKHKHNNVLIDYSTIRMNQGDVLQVSLERASNFNESILINRKKIKEITKNLERQKLSQRFALDNSNSVFPSLFIPLIRYSEETGEPNYENNGCLELEKDSIQKFIELNVAHEHSIFEHPSKFAMFYPRRFPRRRRRRRNASKYLNNPNNEGTPGIANS